MYSGQNRLSLVLEALLLRGLLKANTKAIEVGRLSDYIVNRNNGFSNRVEDLFENRKLLLLDFNEIKEFLKDENLKNETVKSKL